MLVVGLPSTISASYSILPLASVLENGLENDLSYRSGQYHEKRSGAKGRRGWCTKTFWPERTGGQGTSVKCCAWTINHHSS